MTTVTDERLTLESGDRLTRAEFHRRYCTRPDIKKAELIAGVVYVASPVNFQRHGEPDGLIGLWLGLFTAKTPGLRYGDNATVFLEEDSEVQPDCFVFWDPPQLDGGARLLPSGYIEGPPLLVVEVAASSASYDLHDKLEAYRRTGVAEYIVWRVQDRAILWFRLRDGAYVPLVPDACGIVTSEVLPGLRLDVPALLDGDAGRVFATIDVTL